MEPITNRVAERLMVEQPFVHHLQPLPEHCARLKQEGLIDL
jgi:hypothetical protein